ncbi:MAG: VOC family protein [Deltaproteobacteria bacterium]|nr:VOC family protein [Deltaproteobacteria bacterium]
MAIPIHHCADLARSVAFYTDILGATVQWRDNDDAPMFASIKWREHEIYLSSHAGDGVAGTATYFPVPDVDEVFASLLRRGFVPPTGDQVHNAPTSQTWGMREFYVRDPDNNSLRFATPL